MEQRYVLYSEFLGVYLGKDGATGGHNWSKSNPGLKASAPTYTEEAARAKVAELCLGSQGDGGLFVCEAIAVDADYPASLPTRASHKALVAAGFKPWMKEEDK